MTSKLVNITVILVAIGAVLALRECTPRSELIQVRLLWNEQRSVP